MVKYILPNICLLLEIKHSLEVLIMHGENIAVYSALREHILRNEDAIMHETIYMYVTYFALLSVGTVWNSWMSLVSFINLIVFQSMINSNQWSITKASTYIRVFFETNRDDIHWELLHADSFYTSVYESINQNLGWYFRKYGASFLAAISFFSILFPVLNKTGYSIYAIPSISMLQIILALILCVITIYVNRVYFSVRDKRNAKQGQIENVIETFYKSVSSSDTHV